MKMIYTIYRWFHRLCSRPEERGDHSSGYWQAVVRKEALELCKNAKGRLVEIGCGDGLFLIPLALAHPDLDILGTDNNMEQVRRLEERVRSHGIKNVCFLCHEAPGPGLDEGTFDLVVCINVFLVLTSPDPQMFLEYLSRICKKGGRIIFEFRNSLNAVLRIKYALAPFYDHSIRGEHLNTFDPGKMKAILKEVGFRVIEERHPVFPHGRLSPIIIIAAEKI